MKRRGFLINPLSWMLKEIQLATFLLLLALTHTGWMRCRGEGNALCVDETLEEGYEAKRSKLTKTDQNGKVIWTIEHAGNCVRQAEDGG
ncbi:hypothetical protein JXM67_02970 [candidate division WOR-3 bacterium]|nr:hypothetical protein [candidate division WOR-3 bacterium]